MTKEEKIKLLKDFVSGKAQISDLRPKTFDITVFGGVIGSKCFINGIEVKNSEWANELQQQAKAGSIMPQLFEVNYLKEEIPV